MRNTQTFRECLDDFFRRNGKSGALIKFAKVTPDTEGTWRNHKKTPEGLVYFRVRQFLDLVGYRIDEIEDLNGSVQKIVQCLSLDVLSIEDLMKEFGFSTPCQLYDYFRSRVGVGEERLRIFETLADLYEVKRITALKSYEKTLAPYKIASVDDLNSSDKIITDFRSACASVREVGQKLLDADAKLRFKMRNTMTTTNKPELHLTWEVLNSLLKEKMK